MLTTLALLMTTAANQGVTQMVPTGRSTRCATGPVARTYGGQPWNVVSCDDQRSLLILPGDGNPRARFYIIVWRNENGIRIESPGGEARDDPAVEDVRRLTQAELAALFDETLRQ